MAKPVSKPDWTVGNPDFATVTQEPTAQFKQDGWFPNQRPPREFMNWLFFNTGEWIDYFEEVTDLFASQGVIYEAFIGAGGTHVDINAWQADPDIANKKNALLVSNLAVDATQVISVDGSKLSAKADLGITKNGPTGADIGLQIDANRVRVKELRFVGFNDPGVDKAIEVTAAASNNLVFGCMFNDCDTQIDDEAGNGNNNNELIANIIEV